MLLVWVGFREHLDPVKRFRRVFRQCVKEHLFFIQVKIRDELRSVRQFEMLRAIHVPLAKGIQSFRAQPVYIRSIHQNFPLIFSKERRGFEPRPISCHVSSDPLTRVFSSGRRSRGTLPSVRIPPLRLPMPPRCWYPRSAPRWLSM